MAQVSFDAKTEESTSPQTSAQIDSGLTLDQLPKEVLLSIFERCEDHSTILNVMSVNKKFNRIVQSNWSRLPKHKIQGVLFMKLEESRMVVHLYTDTTVKRIPLVVSGGRRLVSTPSTELLAKSRERFAEGDGDDDLDYGMTSEIDMDSWDTAADAIECLLQRVAFEEIGMVLLDEPQTQAVKQALERSQTRTPNFFASLDGRCSKECLPMVVDCVKSTECKDASLSGLCEFSCDELMEKLLKPLEDIEFDRVNLSTWYRDEFITFLALPAEKRLPLCRKLCVDMVFLENWYPLTEILEKRISGGLEKWDVTVITRYDAEFMYEELRENLEEKSIRCAIEERSEHENGMKFKIVSTDGTNYDLSVTLEQHEHNRDDLKWTINRI